MPITTGLSGRRRETRRIGEGRALEKVAATLEPGKSEPGGSKRD